MVYTLINQHNKQWKIYFAILQWFQQIFESRKGNEKKTYVANVKHMPISQNK